jgi:hypothetical protein
MLELDSRVIEGGGREPETDRAALLRENVEPAEEGLVIPTPSDCTDAESSPATEDAALVLAIVERSASGALKIRSRASLYAASRSSRVKSRRPLPFAFVPPLALEPPSSSPTTDEDVDEAVRDALARGRILKTGRGAGVCGAEAEDAAASESVAEGAGDAERAEPLLGVATTGVAGEAEGTGSGAGTYEASLCRGLATQKRQ